jgi:hypothetical protein
MLDLLGSAVKSLFLAENLPIAILSWRVPICRLPTRSLHNLLHRKPFFGFRNPGPSSVRKAEVSGCGFANSGTVLGAAVWSSPAPRNQCSPPTCARSCQEAQQLLHTFERAACVHGAYFVVGRIIEDRELLRPIVFYGFELFFEDFNRAANERILPS